MSLLIWLFINTISILIAAYILPGITLKDFTTAFIVALVLGVLNLFIKPILFLLTLPLTILTFGLFTFVLNAFMIILASALLSPNFHVANFFWALLFSLVISIVNSILKSIN